MEIDENKSGRVVVKKARGKQNRATFLKGILRRASFHWRARTEAMTAARIERGKYKCAMCSGLFGPKEVALDHIKPVVDPKTGFTTWDSYIENLFCEADGFQVICHPCHEVKTFLEDQMREHYKTKGESIPDFTKEKKLSKKKKTEESEQN